MGRSLEGSSSVLVPWLGDIISGSGVHHCPGTLPLLVGFLTAWNWAFLGQDFLPAVKAKKGSDSHLAGKQTFSSSHRFHPNTFLLQFTWSDSCHITAFTALTFIHV